MATTHALLAALLAHALCATPAHAAPEPFQAEFSHSPLFDYDYSADVEALQARLGETTVAPPRPHDPFAEAREMARLNIMDRILIALGPPFDEKLPEAPTGDALATVQTPINITSEPCPYKYMRCSSQTYFPSCEIPHNTSPEIWPQRFNLYFNMSEDFDGKLEVINATLRLYKNNSLPLTKPKTLLINAFVYTKSLTRRRNKCKLMADTQVSSDYIGWVTLPVTELVKRWKRQKNNHGVLITVNDVDDIPWDAPRIFVTMDCASGIIPLPFEVQTDQEGQQYPSLNVRLGSPDDKTDEAMMSSSPPPAPTPPTNSTAPPPSPTMQGDDPDSLYEYNYESDLEEEEDKERALEGLEVVEDEASGDVGGVPSPRPHYAYYDLPAYAPSLDVVEEQTQATENTTNHHHHHNHHRSHPNTETTAPPTPYTHTTPVSSPYEHTTPMPGLHEHTTPFPSPTPPLLSARMSSRRHRGLRDMRFRRKHRGHRRD